MLVPWMVIYLHILIHDGTEHMGLQFLKILDWLLPKPKDLIKISPGSEDFQPSKRMAGTLDLI